MTFEWPPTVLCQHIINSFIKSKTVFNPSWHIWYEIHRNEFYRCLITHSRVVFDIIKNSIYCVFCYALIIVFNTMLIEQIYYIDHFTTYLCCLGAVYPPVHHNPSQTLRYYYYLHVYIHICVCEWWTLWINI